MRIIILCAAKSARHLLYTIGPLSFCFAMFVSSAASVAAQLLNVTCATTAGSHASVSGRPLHQQCARFFLNLCRIVMQALPGTCCRTSPRRSAAGHTCTTVAWVWHQNVIAKVCTINSSLATGNGMWPSGHAWRAPPGAMAASSTATSRGLTAGLISAQNAPNCASLSTPRMLCAGALVVAPPVGLIVGPCLGPSATRKASRTGASEAARRSRRCCSATYMATGDEKVSAPDITAHAAACGRAQNGHERHI